jgi:hypothetical protein
MVRLKIGGTAAFVLLCLLACKTNKRKTDPVPPRAHTSELTAKATEDCAPRLFLAEEPAQSLSDLPAPILTSESITRKDLTYGSIQGKLTGLGTALFYKACLKNNKSICPHKGLLWEGSSEGTYKDTRYWVKDLDKGPKEYVIEARSCVFSHQAAGEVKTSGHKADFQGTNLYCGEKSEPVYLRWKPSQNSRLNNKAQIAQFKRDNFVYKGFQLHRDALVYLNKNRNGAGGLSSAEGSMDHALTNLALLGPSALLTLSGSDQYVIQTIQAGNGAFGQSGGLALTGGGEAANPCAPDLKKEKDIPPPPPLPSPVDRPVPALPPVPPPALLPPVAGQTTPDQAPAQDPYGEDKEECRQRGIRESLVLGTTDGVGQFSWDDRRSVCVYQEANMEPTVVPDLGQPLPICPEEEKQSNLVQRVMGGALIGLGAFFGAVTVTHGALLAGISFDTLEKPIKFTPKSGENLANLVKKIGTAIPRAVLISAGKTTSISTANTEVPRNRYTVGTGIVLAGATAGILIAGIHNYKEGTEKGTGILLTGEEAPAETPTPIPDVTGGETPTDFDSLAQAHTTIDVIPACRNPNDPSQKILEEAAETGASSIAMKESAETMDQL